MKLESKNIPAEESLIEVPPGELVTNYNTLVPFREKFTASEIIEYIISHKYFKLESWSQLGTTTIEGEGLKFCNAIKSLLVTWDKTALDNIEKILLQEPGGFVMDYIPCILIDCNFPNASAIVSFVEDINANNTRFVKHFSKVKEKYEYFLKNNVSYNTQITTAIPAEELRKK